MSFEGIYSKPDDANRYNTARALPSDTMTQWIDALQRHVDPSTTRAILDLGCGTGRFTFPIASAYGCRVIGVEPSAPMLAVASRTPSDIEWLQGNGEEIPVPDGSVDLVFMSQVFHHFVDPAGAFREIHRVLPPNGRLAIRNATRENNAESAWLEFFPEAAAIENRRQIGEGQIVDTVCAQSFCLVAHETIRQFFASSYDEYCDKIGGRGLSSLIAIDDDAFAAGMGRLREWARTQPSNVPIYEPIDLFVFERV